ncbi:class IV adenylate cyclase [Halegenticoccus tardaugens]|uniref:class IV adenylate cyclase n=1 Tax=Halegenticoccus tardaugens TaxID=2071624 RepID=UPI00100BEBC4|nr:class IV adenylate cyclase [Halegenticoccus tardaugens]
MYEVELKVRADHVTARRRLDERGAERVAAVAQRDTYYDAPHRDFAETDEALRIRRETPADGDGEAESATKVTYKGPLVEAESKTREEFETEVADDGAMAGILRGLGFEEAAVVEKERERYSLDGYAVTLDRVDGLGEFVEVEREATEDRVESVRKGAVAVLRSLDLDPDEGIRTSYLGLLLRENNQE